MNDFEELAHRSADAIRQETHHGPVPDFREPTRSGGVLFGVLLVLVVGISAVLWLRDDSQGVVETNTEPDAEPVADDPPSTVDPGDFRLTWPSEAFVVESIGALPVSAAGDASVAHSTLYGRGSSEQPYADADLLVATFLDADGLKNDFSGEEITVRGEIGYRDQTLLELGFEDAVAFYEGDDTAVVVASRTLSFDDLVAVAEGLTFDGHIASSPLSSLTPLAAIDALPFARLWGEAGGWQVTYVDEEAAGSVVVIGRPGGPDRLLMERYIGGAAAATEVRGTDGWVMQTGPGERPGTKSVVWVEEGNVVTLFATGVDPVAVAGELVRIDRSLWDALVAESPPLESTAPGLRPDDAVVLAEGTADVGGTARSWSVQLDLGGSFCLQLDESVSCLGQFAASEAIDNAIATTEQDVFAVGGTAAPETALLTLEWDDGRVDEVVPTYSPLIDRQVFAGVVENHDRSVELVAYDAEGVELARKSYPLDS